MKLKVLTILLLIANTSFSQKIILDEDFKDNKNNWKIETTPFNEKKNIISGRYDILNPTADRYTASVIATNFDGKRDFVIESVITKLPREKEYQLINTELAKQLLPKMNYSNKSFKLVQEGLKIIEAEQSRGVRYNLNLNGRYEWNFSKVTLTKKEQEQLSTSISFVTQNASQLLYNNEMLGVIWGGQDDSGFFVFCIAPENQSFLVASIINGNWTSIIDTKASTAILSGSATNKLSVTKSGDKLNFYINDTNVGNSTNQQFHGSNVGFFVGPETHISADNLVIAIDEPNTKTVSSERANNSYTSSGTGFLISDKGYFVTNNHVIDDASEVWIETNLTGKKETLKAKVVLVDKNNDLAILKLDNLTNLPAPTFGFKSQTMDVGTNVFAMGYPLLSYLGEELKITDGIVSSKTGYKGDISSYQISAPIQPGNSGGALFDKKGYLIGITNAGIPDAQNVGYAIKASYLQNLVELLPEKVDLQLSNKIENLSFTDQIKELTKFVVIVKVK